MAVGLKPYVYRGLFKCGECGCSITAETQKGHNYLRCTKRKGQCSQKYVREEAVTTMIKTELEKVSLSDAVADWLIAEVEKEKTEDDNSSKDQIQKVNAEAVAVDAKLDKLMTAYLENALTLPEYQETKNKLITEKQILKDKLAAFGRVSSSRFEPVVNFLNDCRQAGILAKSNDQMKIREFFQKVGSNPLLRDRALVFSPRAPFAFVSEIPKNANNDAGGAAGGVWGGMPPRPPHCDALSPFSGDSDFFANLCSHQESNLDHELRRLVFYPLNYGSDRGTKDELARTLVPSERTNERSEYGSDRGTKDELARTLVPSERTNERSEYGSDRGTKDELARTLVPSERTNERSEYGSRTSIVHKQCPRERSRTSMP